MNRQNTQPGNHIDISILEKIFWCAPETNVDVSGFSEKDVMDFLRKVFEKRRVSIFQTLPVPFVYKRVRKPSPESAGEKIRSVKIELPAEIRALINGNKEEDGSPYIFPVLNITSEEKENRMKTHAKEKAAFEKKLDEIANGKNESFSKAIDHHLQNIARKLHLDVDLNFHSFQNAIQEWNLDITIANMQKAWRY